MCNQLTTISLTHSVITGTCHYRHSGTYSRNIPLFAYLREQNFLLSLSSVCLLFVAKTQVTSQVQRRPNSLQMLHSTIAAAVDDAFVALSPVLIRESARASQLNRTKKNT